MSFSEDNKPDDKQNAPPSNEGQSKPVPKPVTSRNPVYKQKIGVSEEVDKTPSSKSLRRSTGKGKVKEIDDVSSQDIKDNSYFAQGLEWYNANFVDPTHQFSMIFVMAVTSFIGFIIIFLAFASYFPIAVREPFYFSHDIKGREMVTLEAMQDYNTEDYNLAISRFFLKRYTQIRESYQPQKIRIVESLILDMSTDEEFYKFYEETNLNNPNSFIAVYGKSAAQSIDVTSVDINIPSQIDGVPVDTEYGKVFRATAKVNFYAYLKIRGAEKPKVSRWVADIEFDFKNVIVDQETNEFVPHYFKVIKYNSKQIG